MVFEAQNVLFHSQRCSTTKSIVTLVTVRHLAIENMVVCKITQESRYLFIETVISELATLSDGDI